jgi:broad specificity phosphatase PhoE
MTRIILIRHGQTAWNKVERIRGQVDIALDETGLIQAAATARRVAEDWQPSAVVCSPLRRAVQTAEVIARQVGQDVRPEPGLLDINFGQWQGLSPAEVEDRWPEMAHAWLTAPHTVQFPGGESLDRVQQRSMTALHALLERHRGEELVAVGHTVVNRVVMCAVLGLDNSHHWRIGQQTCAINVFRWHEGVFYVDALNDTCHLRGLT